MHPEASPPLPLDPQAAKRRRVRVLLMVVCGTFAVLALSVIVRAFVPQDTQVGRPPRVPDINASEAPQRLADALRFETVSLVDEPGANAAALEQSYCGGFHTSGQQDRRAAASPLEPGELIN